MSIELLQEKIHKQKTPVLLPLDPASVPPAMGDGAAGLERFGAALLEALAGTVPAVKLDPAWYLVHGPEGLRAMERLCEKAHALDYYVIVETRRSDDEDGAALCARTWFEGPCQADALSVGAFSGSDGIRPYLPWCEERGKALFVTARTANRSAREVQDLLSGDRVVHTVMLDLVLRWGGDRSGQSGYLPVGAAVGAARGGPLAALRAQYDRLFFLVEGTEPKAARGAFDRFGQGAIVEAPRRALDAGNEQEDPIDAVCAEIRAFCAALAAQVTVI